MTRQPRASWVGGLAIVVMAIAALVQFAEWEDWVALVAGVLAGRRLNVRRTGCLTARTGQSTNSSPAIPRLAQTRRAWRDEWPPKPSSIWTSKVGGRTISPSPAIRAPVGEMSRSLASSVEAPPLKTQRT